MRPSRSGLALLAVLAVITLCAYAVIIPMDKGWQIPLASIYTTSAQEGTKPLNVAMNRKADGSYEYVEPYGADLHQIFREYRGPSNVFLVRGSDINEAVRTTADALVGGRPAETPDAMQSEIWLVAYFGTMGSSHGACSGWSVQSVEVKRRTIRISFLKGPSDNKDLHPYLVWVPLGKLQSDFTTLELFDVDQQAVTLSRCVRAQY